MSLVVVKLNGRGAKGRAVKGVYAALQAGGEYLLSEANKAVPLEEATLERSGLVTVDRSTTQAAVSYDTPYARRQHEELTWRHDPGRTAKWLELVFITQTGVALEVMAARIRRSIGGQGG